MQTRVRYTFTGEVQGVGFRFRAYHAARSYGLTGWVRNEYDGSVTMEVQGEKAAIEALLEAVGDGHFVRIDTVDTQVLPIDAGERSFEICD